MKCIEMKLGSIPADTHKQINVLLKQLVHSKKTYHPLSKARFEKILSDPRNILLGVWDGNQLIGTGTLLLVEKIYGRYAYIEDMMVHSDYRRQGIGSKLTKALITAARKRGVKTIELTTRPSRVAANKLYQKFGFQPKETNVYRLILKK